MAKQTRQQRRDRRAQQQPALAGGPPPRTAAATTANGADSEPRRASRQRSDERHIPGSRADPLLPGGLGELKKVEWPSQKQLVSGTAVVLIACLIIGVFLYLNDTLWQYVVQHILLR